MFKLNFPPKWEKFSQLSTEPYRISDLGSDIRSGIGYPIRFGIYQTCLVNPIDVFIESFSDTQTSGS